MKSTYLRGSDFEILTKTGEMGSFQFFFFFFCKSQLSKFVYHGIYIYVGITAVVRSWFLALLESLTWALDLLLRRYPGTDLPAAVLILQDI